MSTLGSTRATRTQGLSVPPEAPRAQPSPRLLSAAFWRLRVLGLSDGEASFERRRFRSASQPARARLERIGQTFLTGYRQALLHPDAERLGRSLEGVEPEDRGFAFEGAAMALGLLDLLTPWGSGRLHRFLQGPGRAHVYLVHVGAGWALARVPFRRGALLARLDPLLRWLAFDGVGFHEGYFHHRRALERQTRPRWLSGYALRAFDQGLGRSLWFVEGAHVPAVAAALARFAPERRADLWSGVGLASAYAGGAEECGLAPLRDAAGAHLAEAAQGAAFAAEARRRAGIPAEHTDRVCRLLCGRSAEEAAAVTEEALAGLPREGAVPPYETWRQRIQARLAGRGRA